MATITPDLAGHYRGKVGNVVYYVVDDGNYARRMSDKPKRKAKGDQRSNCLKLRTLGMLGGTLTPVLRVTMPREVYRTARFVDWNYGAVTVEDVETGEVSVDYPSLVFTKGSLMPAIVTGTLSGNTMNFECAPQTGYGLAADDQAYLAFVDGVGGVAWLEELGSRGEGGSASVTVPQFCSPENVNVYTFMLSRDGKRTSKTVSITLGTGE